jgi:hypothetical protein
MRALIVCNDPERDAGVAMVRAAMAECGVDAIVLRADRFPVERADAGCRVAARRHHHPLGETRDGVDREGHVEGRRHCAAAPRFAVRGHEQYECLRS